MTHPDRNLNPATCLMPRAMLPEPVLCTSIQAMPNREINHTPRLRCLPMRTLDLSGSLLPRFPRVLSVVSAIENP